jgi:phage-related protein (TIGR01555 family)
MSKKPTISAKQVTPNPQDVAQIIQELALAQLINDTSLEQKEFQFKYPQVMGADGKVTTADKVAESVKFADGMAMDSISPVGAGLNGFNQFYFNKLNRLLLDSVFLGYAEYSLLAQNGILNAICDTPATEMTSKWVEFVSVNDGDKSDKIKQLQDEFERLNVKDLFKRAAYLTFQQGGCMIYPQIGDENTLDRAELQTELDIDKLKIDKGSLKYITIIEPIWYVPIRYVTDNPLSKWFYRPEFYTVMGTIVHESRLLKFIHNEAPHIIPPQYNFNGMPMMGQAIPYVMNFETMKNTITEIVKRLNLTVVKTNLQAIVNGVVDKNQDLNSGAGAALGARLRALNATRNNLGTLAIDMNNEDIVNLTMNLTGLDKLWSQSAEFMCIVPKLPATELLGISPQGFNATGEFEMKKFYRQIKAWQESIFRQNLIKLMHMAMLNIWGEIDKDISFEFCNLAEANELEESTIGLNNATEAATYFDRGIVKEDEIRAKISKDKDSGWNSLEDLEAESENDYPEYSPPTESLNNQGYGSMTNEPLGVAK